MLSYVVHQKCDFNAQKTDQPLERTVTPQKLGQDPAKIRIGPIYMFQVSGCIETTNEETWQRDFPKTGSTFTSLAIFGFQRLKVSESNALRWTSEVLAFPVCSCCIWSLGEPC